MQKNRKFWYAFFGAIFAITAPFLLTLKMTEPVEAKLETVRRDGLLIVSSENDLTQEQLQAYKLFHETGYPDETLKFVHREWKFAIYRIERQ